MKVHRVRRVGDSNMVALPKELEALGYTPGTDVLIEELPDGSLHLLKTDDLRQRIRDAGARVVDEDRNALDILARHDRDIPTADS
jgi:antitoxin component of MazEF toxin-antitoxin module